MRSIEEPMPGVLPTAELEASRDLMGSDAEKGVDVAAAIFRYKWAVIVPSIAGLVLGLVLWTQLPEVWESKAELLVESDQPLMLDSVTGDVVKAIPGPDIVQAQLFSDEVLNRAANHNAMADAEVLEILDQEYQGSFRGFIYDTVEFDAGQTSSNNANSMVFVISAKHTSDAMALAAVTSLSDSLKAYYDGKRTNSLDDIRSYMQEAWERQKPKLEKLEEEYGAFRSKVELQFDEDGVAINPHRTMQLELTQQKRAAETELRQIEEELKMTVETLKNSTDPLVSIGTIGTLLGKEFPTTVQRRRALGIKDDDLDLTRLGFKEELVPLYVQREEVAAEFGENHPSVKSYDRRIEASEQQFEKLSLELTNRIKELIADTEDERKEALEAARTVVTSLEAKKEMANERIRLLQEQIDQVKESADALSRDEQTNAAYLRQIEQAQKLFAQLEDQLRRIDLADKDNGVELSQLTAPTVPRVVGPNLLILGAGGLGMGLLLGCGLAFLLESQAGTFRSAEEIAAILRLPILAHIPFDPGRKRKLKKGEEDPFSELDDKLSVVHRPMSMAAEATRACRTAVFFEAASSDAKLIQVTSPLPSDGKSTIAGNLAASMAQAGKRVLLIDADLRRPQLSDNFAMPDKLGMTNVLNGDCDPADAIHETPIENLFVMPSGPIPVNPAEALTLPQTGELLNWLRDRYDAVVIDTPPLLVVTDASIIASMVDGVLLTVKVRRKSKANAKEAVSILRGVHARIMGVVINASDDGSGSDGYKGYGYYRYSRYAAKYNVDNGYGGPRYGYSSRKRSQRPGVLIAGRGLALADQRDSQGGANANGTNRKGAGKPAKNGSHSAIGLLAEDRDLNADDLDVLDQE